MKLEKKYYLVSEREKIKKYGQYFTPYEIADFMAQWISQKSTHVLDPAVGNGIFEKLINQYNSEIIVDGFEVDKDILNFFKVYQKNIKIQDYLLSSWDIKYDGIICNPPYNKFQSIDNRDYLIKEISDKTGIKLNGYTNQYLLFLTKSINQLKKGGRLIYIIPNEFLNSNYGTPVKEYLIEQRILRAIVNFESNVFEKATTTSCLIMIEKSIHSSVEFITITDLEELDNLNILGDKFSKDSLLVDYNELNGESKWIHFLQNKIESNISYRNLTHVKKYCKVTRGIATGANDFFVFNEEKRKYHGLDVNYFDLCLCKSSDINDFVCDQKVVNEMIDSNKNIYLLSIDGETDISDELRLYLNSGLKNEINKKYLPSLRTPWYSMEKKESSPILIGTASRGNFKVIRNLSGIKNLTTFHSINVFANNLDLINILYCYLITPTAQDLLRRNKKELGNGLSKFQPNDLNNAMMLDLNVVTKEDLSDIEELYDKLVEKNSTNIEVVLKLDEIFKKYLL